MSQQVEGPEPNAHDAAPAARFESLVTTESDGELIVYDVRSHHVHRLNAITTAVWRRCDGRRSVTEIARSASAETGQPIRAASVQDALKLLAEANLLTGPAPASVASRRAFVRRTARLGGAAIPALVSITAPLASASASPLLQCPARTGRGPLEAESCAAAWSTCLCYRTDRSHGQCTEVGGVWTCV